MELDANGFVPKEKRGRVTPSLITRSSEFSSEYANFVNSFYIKDKNSRSLTEFIEKHKKEYPRLLEPNMHIRFTARDIFTKYYYSLRERRFIREPIPTEEPIGWLK